MPAHSFHFSLAFLQSPAGTTQLNSGGLALAAGIIAFLRRKHPIGGWLFYFFCQLCLGLMLTGITTHWNRYLPRAWSNPADYLLFAVTGLSRTMLLAEIAAAAAVLLATREWRWVATIKYSLAAYAFLTVLKLLVDVFRFPAGASLDLASLSFPCVWAIYFDVSRRVRSVFQSRSWGSPKDAVTA